MDEAEPATSGDGRVSAGETALDRRLDRLVVRSQAAALWEQAWPLLWRGLGVALTFLAVSWLGIWLDLAPLWRGLGLAAFGLGFVLVLVPLLRLRRPSRAEALARIDREAASRGGTLAHGPASSIGDTLAVGQGDPATRALWALHQKRAAALVARLSAGPPRPAMPRRDPFALRAAILVLSLIHI